VTDPEGLLLVDKPGRMTSHDVVDIVRRTLGTRKVGHAGTLDPMATGLLIWASVVRPGCCRFLGGLPKTYEGSARLGVETTTLDADGRRHGRAAGRRRRRRHPQRMESLMGDSLQAPPAYSA
jgi:tRNA pseudouridine55 synthase